jgi:hypothetical protein
VFFRQVVSRSKLPHYSQLTPFSPYDNLHSDFGRLQSLAETGLHYASTRLLCVYLSSETLPYLVEIDEPRK